MPRKINPTKKFTCHLMQPDADGNNQAVTRRFTIKELRQAVGDNEQAKRIWNDGDFSVEFKEVKSQDKRKAFQLK